MVTTRSKTGEPNLSSKKHVSQGIQSEPESEPDASHQNPDPRRRKKRRRVTEPPQSISKGKSAKLRKTNGGDRQIFESLPLDIVFEIATHLHPLDLLHLARTSKSARNVLMSKASVTVWKTARLSLDPPVPNCPSDQNEPQWARLLFEKSCTLCGAPTVAKVAWNIRLRGCGNCYKRTFMHSRNIMDDFPQVKTLIQRRGIPEQVMQFESLSHRRNRGCPQLQDIEEVLELLPFIYQGGPQPTYNLVLPQAPSRLTRFYYRPDVLLVINALLSHQAAISSDAPGSKQRFEDFKEAKRKEVIGILNTEGELKNWAREEERRRKEQVALQQEKRRVFFTQKLIGLGYATEDAEDAIRYLRTSADLKKSWESERPFLVDVADQSKRNRLRRQRGPTFNSLYKAILDTMETKPPLEGMLLAPRHLIEDFPDIKAIIETERSEPFEDAITRILPGVLEMWWRQRIVILVSKISTRYRNPSDPPNPDGGQSENNGSGFLIGPAFNPSFVAPFLTRDLKDQQAMLYLAKAVFSCTCASFGRLDYWPLYFDGSLAEHYCVRDRSQYWSSHGWDMSGLNFDARASRHVDAVCHALGLDPLTTTFAALDEIDARFRCLDCPFKRILMNWRKAITHTHPLGFPSFAILSDEETATIKAIELNRPGTDLNPIFRRIRCNHCKGPFGDLTAVSEHLLDAHQKNTTTADYTVNPCIPPEPVAESEAFPTGGGHVPR